MKQEINKMGNEWIQTKEDLFKIKNPEGLQNLRGFIYNLMNSTLRLSALFAGVSFGATG